jgi:hypothetical protein
MAGTKQLVLPPSSQAAAHLTGVLGQEMYSWAYDTRTLDRFSPDLVPVFLRYRAEWIACEEPWELTACDGCPLAHEACPLRAQYWGNVLYGKTTYQGESILPYFIDGRFAVLDPTTGLWFDRDHSLAHLINKVEEPYDPRHPAVQAGTGTPDGALPAGASQPEARRRSPRKEQRPGDGPRGHPGVHAATGRSVPRRVERRDHQHPGDPEENHRRHKGDRDGRHPQRRR